MEQRAMEKVAPRRSEIGMDLGPHLERHAWIAPVFILVLSLSINLAGNSGTGLWDRDEPRYAVAVREMLARGDWLVPTYNGEPRYQKPILLYWLIALGTWLGGSNPFGVRLASALAGTGTCVLTWHLARRRLGTRAGLLAGIMMSVAPIAVGSAKLATPDATLALLLVGCQCCLWELARRPSWFLAGTFWALLGLAFLTKGPIAPAFLLTSAGLAWWWGWPLPRVWRRLSPRHGLPGCALLAVPWYIAVTIKSHGEFLRFAVGTQIVQRVATGMEEHGGFLGYYALFAIPAFAPWSALLPAALAAAWRRRKNEPDLVFVLGWVIGPWAFLECLQTRLIHYYLPAFPACALLVAWLVEAVADEGVTLRRMPLGRLGMGLMAGIGIAMSVVLMSAALIVPLHLRVPLGLLAIVMGVGTPVAMLWMQRAATRRGTLALGAAWAVFMLILGGWLLPAAERYRTSRRVGERLAALVAQTGLEPILLNYQEPGLIYAMGRRVRSVGDFGGVFRLLEQQESFLTVVTPNEARDYGSRLGLEVSPVEDLEGFSLTKGRKESMLFVIVRRGHPRELARGTVAHDPPRSSPTRR
jgi:4-amino-4-deoxy-L-arabinose transferase-like glycosyltransferase